LFLTKKRGEKIMRTLFGTILTACLFVAAPVFAGDLTFDNNQTVWHSSKCTRPVPPQSVQSVDPETKGNAMNALVAKRNAFADEAQEYMNCVSREAENDQNVIIQAITSGAQQEIDSVLAETKKLSVPMQTPQK
jgi:hypothetical protein